MLLTSWLCGCSGSARSPQNDWPRLRRRLRPHEVRRWMALRVEPLEVRLVPTAINVVGGNLLIMGDSSGTATNDVVRIQADTAASIYFIIDTNNVPSTTTIPFNTVTGRIIVNTLGGDDSLIVDFSKGEFPNLIEFDGGGQANGDSLRIGGGGVLTKVTHTFGVAGDTIEVLGALTSKINYIGLESPAGAPTILPVVDQLSAVERVLTFSGSSEVITLQSGGNTDLKIESSDGDSVGFKNAIGSLTLNAGAGSDLVNIVSVNAGFKGSLTVNGGDGDDTLKAASFVGATPLDSDVIINGDAGNDVVEWNASVNLGNGHSLNINLTDDAANGDVDQIVVANNAQVLVTGVNAVGVAGTIDLRASRSIELNNAKLQTEGGSLTVVANRGISPTAGDFVGVALLGGAIVSTTSGNVTIRGRGGDGGAGAGQQIGIRLDNGSVVTGGIIGTTLTIDGIGGAAAGDFSSGVQLEGGSSVGSIGGDVSVVGQGGGFGTSSNNFGVWLHSSGGQISAGASGKVTVNGTGGVASSFANNGVVWEGNSSNITSAGGAVLVTGAATFSPDNFAIAIYRDNLVLDPRTTTIDGGAGMVVLRPLTAVTLINLGGDDVPSNPGPTTLGLTNAELNRITAGQLLIGDPMSGPLTVTAPITLGTHLSITSGVGITVGQSITLTADKDLRAEVFGTTGLMRLATANADLSVTGAGTISLSAGSLDLLSGSSLVTGGNSVFLKANSMNLVGTVNAGAGMVEILGAVEGRAIDLGAVSNPPSGPLSLSNVELNSITAGSINIGDDLSGAITISSAIIRSAATNLFLKTAANNNISFLSGGSLDANGGDVSLLTDFLGTGAILGDAAATNIRGNLVSLGAGSGGIGSGTTPVSFDATSLRTMTGGNGNQFLRELNSVVLFGLVAGGIGGLTAGSGTINLNGGTFTLGGSNRINDEADVAVAFGATLDVGQNNEAIDKLVLIDGSITGNGTLTGSSTFDLRKGSIGVNLAGANTAVGVSKVATNTVTLSGANNSYSGETLISSGTLALVSTTSNNSIPNSLTITVQSGAVLDVTGLDTVATADTLILANGQTLQGSGTVNGKLIAPNGSIVSPGISPGILNSGSVNLQPGSTLNIEINGILPGTDYDQLNVTGTVALGGTLNATRGFTPDPGDTFVIINNDGSDSVSGTFAGWSPGSLQSIGGAKFHVYYDFDSGDGQRNDVALIANRLPVISAQTFFTSHTAPNNSVVGSVVATDLDSAVNFTITAGNTGTTFAIDNNSGQLTVINSAGLVSGTSFGLTVEVTDDAGVKASALVTVVIANQAPSGADRTVSTNEDTAYTFTAGDFGFSDPNDSPANNLLAVKITTLPLVGTFTNNGNTFLAGQFIAVADITSGKLKFTPVADSNGAGITSFTFQVQDDGGTVGSGIDLDPTANTITIDVTGIADITNDSLTTNEDSAVTANVLTGTNGATADTFENGTARITSVTQGANGSVSFLPGGAVTYTPVADFNGNDSFTYTVTSGGVTETATVSVVPNPPPATPSDVDQTNSGRFENVVPEGALPGTRVGITLFSTDPEGEAVFYRLTDDAGGRFAVDPLTGVITVKTSYLLNFADAAQHTIRAVARDVGGIQSPEAVFVIHVTQVPADALPIASILPSHVSVVEGDPTDPGNKFIEFLVKLNKPSVAMVQIDFSTRVGDEPGFVRPEGIPADASFATDVPGPWDFFRSFGRLTFDPGVTEQTVRVQLRPDDRVEPNELFFVQLTSPVNVQLAAGQSVAVAEILDDDSVPQVIVETTQVLEGAAPGQKNLVFHLNLMGNFPLGLTTATVDYTTGNIAIDTATAGVDYTPISGTLTFTVDSRHQEIRIPITGDLANETDETVSLQFTNAVGLGLSRNFAVGTIINDDSPNVVVTITPAVSKVREGHNGTSQVELFVTLIGQPTTDVSVSYATANHQATAGTDYVAVDDSVIFTLADIAAGLSTKSIFITVNGDTDIEPDEGFSVSLSLPTAPLNVSLDPDKTLARVVIRNDDQAVLTEDGDALFAELLADLTGILNAGGGAKHNPALVAEMQRRAELIARSLGLTKAIIMIIDPVDFVLTDPVDRQAGYTENTGSVNQVPGTYYSGDGAVELLIVPLPPDGTYNVQLAGLGGDFNASVTLVNGDRATGGVVSDFSGQYFQNGDLAVQVGDGSRIPVGLGLAAARSGAAGAVGVVGAFGNSEFHQSLASAFEQAISKEFDGDNPDSRATGLMVWLSVSARTLRQEVIDPLWESLGTPLGDLLGEGRLTRIAIPSEFLDHFWSQVGQTLTGVPSGIYRLGNMLESVIPTLIPRRIRSALPRSGDQGQPNSSPGSGVKTKRSSLERPSVTPPKPRNGNGSGQTQPPNKPNATQDKPAQTSNSKKADAPQASTSHTRWLWFNFKDEKSAPQPATRRDA